MLTPKTGRSRTARSLPLFFVISFFTFTTVTFAELKKDIAEEYRSLGYDAQQKGDLVQALTYYKKAIFLGAGDSALLNDMGILYEKAGLFPDALDAYLRAIQLDASFMPAYLNLGYLYKNLGDKRMAERFFKERFERGKPGDPWTEKAKEELLKLRPDYQNWFDFVDEQRRDAEGKQLAQEILKQKQQEFYQLMLRAKEHVQKGQELMKGGEHEKAIAEFDHALKISPGDQQALKLKRQAFLEITKKDIQKYSDHAVKMLDAGDAASAKREIQRMLTTISNEPMGHSK